MDSGISSRKAPKKKKHAPAVRVAESGMELSDREVARHVTRTFNSVHMLPFDKDIMNFLGFGLCIGNWIGHHGHTVWLFWWGKL